MIKKIKFTNSIDYLIFTNCTEENKFDVSFSSFFEENFSSQLSNFSDEFSSFQKNLLKPKKCFFLLRNEFFAKIGEKLSIIIGQFFENNLKNPLNFSEKTLIKFSNRNCPVDIKLHSNLLIKKLVFYNLKPGKIDEKTKIHLSFYLNFIRKWENSYDEILDIKKKRKSEFEKSYSFFPDFSNLNCFIYLQKNFQKKIFKNSKGKLVEKKSKKDFTHSTLLLKNCFWNNFDLFLFFLSSEIKFSLNKNIIFVFLRKSFFMNCFCFSGKEILSFFEKKLKFKINSLFFFREIKKNKYGFFLDQKLKNYFFFSEDFFKLKSIKTMDNLAWKFKIFKKVLS
ncbi:hypothetical protein HAN_1g99 (nucleomorph) [Hemiselmis andersenii]|uniref:Uncharacterized protein n=1 Tax=Hemiselmis andersenii TaxID=464988 RepID=A9BKA8_HEMAN|nr:hypothetical protein HAN_1g99 [Hemiselmis andersenii]ABW97941.1 hypothetical protein HAN_1g99 [Hemiselmis andersenii]|mmetsp:Transcript_27723/g.67580  ORF Transcript_27723/g.67580 Transcript_27723/m.67580 type:complete len:337 (+) Transcript_27723:122-1132(+)